MYQMRGGLAQRIGESVRGEADKRRGTDGNECNALPDGSRWLDIMNIYSTCAAVGLAHICTVWLMLWRAFIY